MSVKAKKRAEHDKRKATEAEQATNHPRPNAADHDALAESRSAVEGCTTCTGTTSFCGAVSPPVPVPVVLGDDRADLRKLFQLHADGLAEPEPVALPPLWSNPTRAERQLHDLLRVRFGLLVGDGRSEPLMLATSEIVRENIVFTQTGASKVLHRFEKGHIIWSPGEMPALGKGNGTRLFLPGRKPEGPEPEEGWRILVASDGVPVPGDKPGAVAVEAQDGVPSGTVEPCGEPEHESGVSDAVRGGPTGTLDGPLAVESSAENRTVMGHAGAGYAGVPTVSDDDLRKIDATYDVAERWVQWALREARPGNRNDVGFKLACQLRNLRLERVIAEVFMGPYVDGVPTGDHPYNSAEAMASVESAYREPPRPPSEAPRDGRADR